LREGDRNAFRNNVSETIKAVEGDFAVYGLSAFNVIASCKSGNGTVSTGGCNLHSLPPLREGDRNAFRNNVSETIKAVEGDFAVYGLSAFNVIASCKSGNGTVSTGGCNLANTL